MTAEEQDRYHLKHNAHFRTHLTNLNVPLQRILIPLLLLQPFLIYAKKSLIKSGPHEFSKFWKPPQNSGRQKDDMKEFTY